MTEKRSAEESERELKKHGDKLEEQIEHVREDWERKKEDTAVPGATGDDENRLPDGPG
jgi:hypothetical protein